MNEKELWKKVLQKLEPLIKKQYFVTWFQNTAITLKEEGVVTIGVPTAFARDWISNRYNVKILQALQELDDEVVDINYEVVPSLTEDDHRKVNIFSFLTKSKKKVRKVAKKKEVHVTTSSGQKIRSKMLNPKYSLDNFVVGKENRLAHAACMAVATNPGQSYNPLFIYGGVGLGKTHLLQGTGNYMIAEDENRVVIYITAERFMTELIECIQKRTVSKFKDKYRNVDCLILDDVQFLAVSEKSQEELFHTFNDLYDSNKQIILSSDRPPKELKGLADRLKSRFEMGMMVDVLAPDYETRLAILKAKCRLHEVILVPEVLDFIAYNVQNSVRELEGVLLQAIAHAQLENSTPTIRTVGSIIKKLNKDSELNDYTDKFNSKRVVRTSDEVLDIVSNYFRIDKGEIIGSSRQRQFMVPRQIAMYLIRKELDLPYETIGQEFGNRNHTTVMHACEAVIKKMKKDEKLVRDLNSIKNEMGM